MENIPRRSRLDLNTKEELIITEAISAIENLGADTRLTNAQIKLQEAKDLLSDYVDDGKCSNTDCFLCDNTNTCTAPTKIPTCKERII